MEQQSVLPTAIIPAKTTLDTSISASTEVTLERASTVGDRLIEVSAISGGIYLLWGNGTVSNSNFHEFIADGQTRHYVVPNSIDKFNVIEKDSGAEIIVIEK